MQWIRTPIFPIVLVALIAIHVGFYSNEKYAWIHFELVCGLFAAYAFLFLFQNSILDSTLETCRDLIRSLEENNEK